MSLEYCIYIYISITVYIYTCCRFKWKTEVQASFLNSFTLIVQTEVCHLSVCLQRKKWKFYVCKRTKRTKRTKWSKRTFPSKLPYLRHYPSPPTHPFIFLQFSHEECGLQFPMDGSQLCVVAPVQKIIHQVLVPVQTKIYQVLAPVQTIIHPTVVLMQTIIYQVVAPE